MTQDPKAKATMEKVKEIRKNIHKWTDEPCDNFTPTQTPLGINEHDCFRCHNGTVSFCENCNRDHHVKPEGYKSCTILMLCDEVEQQEERIKELEKLLEAMKFNAENSPRKIAEVTLELIEEFLSPTSDE